MLVRSKSLEFGVCLNPFLFDSRRGRFTFDYILYFMRDISNPYSGNPLTEEPLNGVVRQNYLTTVTISHFAVECFVIRSLNGNEASLFSQMMGHRINSAVYVKVNP